MLVAAICVGAVALYFVYLSALKYVRLLQCSSKLPGPPTLPLLGNTLDLANKTSLGETSSSAKKCVE